MSRRIDLTGKQFGRWTAIKQVSRGGPTAWLCRCECGSEGEVASQNLRLGVSKSCGCLKAELNSLPEGEAEANRKLAASIRDKMPKRKEQKRVNQMKYRVSDKAVLAAFHRFAKKRKKIPVITDAEVLALREVPCATCGRQIEGTGTGFVMLKPRGALELTNMVSQCGICRRIKSKKSFDPIAFGKGLLRRFWKKTPMAAIAKARARRGRGQYECASCKGLFPQGATQIDHISPVVDPVEGYKDLDTFCTRLFCDDNNLQILCVSCHSLKTVAEHQIRAKTKKKEKKK